jgi:hypothetical protein
MKPYAKYCAYALVAIFASTREMIAQTETSPAPKNGSQSLVNGIPIPVGNEWKGVHFPYTENKKLKMHFDVEVMKRKDTEHVMMTNAKIITFDDDQKPDITLLLPISVLDLTTRILTTDKSFVLQRTDLELMGDSLRLDTLKRQATIVGKVKMIIYNFQESATKEAHE